MLAKGLQKILDDKNKPFYEKIAIANHVYKSSEFTFGHKEVFLLKWIIRHSSRDYHECWDCILSWLKSTQFRKLNKSDINKEDFISIVELIHDEILQMKAIEKSTIKIILDSILLLIDNDIFQHYFKYNVDIYCQLISSVLHKTEYTEYLTEFLRMDIFNKNIMAHKRFQKNFIVIVLPGIVECLKKHNSSELFQCVSKSVQKCLFMKNQKSFKNYINHFFEDVELERKIILKSLIKSMVVSYKTDEDATITYKIIFHAFCLANRSDFEIIYKFFILLVHTIGFNLKDKFILSGIADFEISQSELSVTKSQEILSVLFDVLIETNCNINLAVNNVTFGEFVTNILKQLIFLGMPCYEIFIKALTINPLLIEPLTDDIIIYVMEMNSHQPNELYETIILHIFDIYTKLRRVENFISKMVHTLSRYFSGEKKPMEEIYNFKGQIDTEKIIRKEIRIQADNIFTDKILQHFSKCICNLASWQVINIFKTVLHQFRQILNNLDQNDCITYFIEIVSILLSTFLSSVRIGEHIVIPKLVKELEDLKNILQQFGITILNREHNQKLMKSFLNVAYHWAEVYLSLEYYSMDDVIHLNKKIDNDFTACNVTYLHSYLTVKQWHLISERITNFGEVACKHLLQKLYIQKLRAMHLSEKSVSDDIIQNVTKSITTNIEILWKDVVEDKYVINNLLVKMGPVSIVSLVEKLIHHTDMLRIVCSKPHITNSCFLITAINYVVITRINKLITRKREKMNSDTLNKAVGVKILSMFSEDNFLNKDHKDTIENARILYYSSDSNCTSEWSFNEEKVDAFFQILEKFPMIFCPEVVQKLYLMYFCSLHRDLSNEFNKGRFKKLQMHCEKLIIGILQHCKFRLVHLFTIADLCKDIVENYDEWEQIFLLITENVSKDEHSVEAFEPVVLDFTEKLLTPAYMRCCVIIINMANKLKKVKMSKDTKTVAEKYKTVICDKVLDVVLKNKPTTMLIDGYSLALKHFLSNNEEEKLSKLLTKLDLYIDLALNETEHPNSVGNLKLFITVLENKVKMQSVIDNEFSLKIWNVCKEREVFDAKTDLLSQLVKLVFELVSAEEFATMVTDLLKVTEESMTKNDYQICANKLSIWESILSCNLNPSKIKSFQSALEELLQKFIILQEQFLSNENWCKCIFNLQKTIIQTVHLPLTPPIIDTLLLSLTLLCDGQWKDDKSAFNVTVTVLDSLLRYRKPLIIDRLPCFLQIYRMLLKNVCKNSNTDLNLDATMIKEFSDCSHQLEKLTKNLVSCQKDMGRIAMYLVVDILQQYEQVTLYSNVKIHLNNCIYSLLTICDQHAVAFLMRALSSASTELFKDIYENYKKFYRFTGKV